MGDLTNFIVLDTEGVPSLSEIALYDHQGQLLYEAFAQEDPRNFDIKFKIKPLATIIQDLCQIIPGKTLVCHSVEHDAKVLRYSFQISRISPPPFKFVCTYELARQQYPYLPSYSLEALAKHFRLKVNQKPFDAHQAHRARYDAAFTYQLYRLMLEQNYIQSLQNTVNPFSSSRVDTPFQEHPDFKELYQREFKLLKSIIFDIKNDRNHQSQGAVVIGEPGTGKTHLMMRLAQELLKINRLLFIRQPNNSQSVLYHIYSRILESFVETVPGTTYTQLEHLLANSFVKLISSTPVMTLNQKDRDILAVLKAYPLGLYERLGAEGRQKKREYWQHIERRTDDWWLSQYGSAGYALQIIKGIIKFCSYTDARKRELVTRWLAANELEAEELESVGLSNWQEEMSKESFSLEAISVFSKLSMLDEPLMIVFDQLEGLGLEHNRDILLAFGEAVKEIFTHVPNSLIILNLFPDRWQQFQSIFDGSIIDRISQNQIHLQHPSLEVLRQILELKTQSIGVDLNLLFTAEELQDILNFGSIRKVLNRASEYFKFKIQQVPLSPQIPIVKLISPPVSPPDAGAVSAPNLNTPIEQRIQDLEQEVLHLKARLEDLEASWETKINPLSNLSLVQEETHHPAALASVSAQNPIIQYLYEQRKVLEQAYSKLQIITDSDDYGKLLAIAEAFRELGKFEIDTLRMGKRKLPEHLLIQRQNQEFVIAFLQGDGSAFTSRIKNLNELVIAHLNIQFILLRDCRQSVIKGAVGKQELEKFSHTPNGQFKVWEREERLDFELIYKLIIEIQNRDVEFNLEAASLLLRHCLNQSWLLECLGI